MLMDDAPGWLRSVEWCTVAILVMVFGWHGFLPGWRTLKSEFPDYYLAAELYHQGIPLERAYEWTWFQRQNDHLGVREGLVSFAPNPPTLILSLLPFTRLQPLAAKRAWMLSSLALLALSLWMLSQVTSLRARRVTLICWLCILPLSADFSVARHYVTILFLICAAYYLACRKRYSFSGAMWSLAAALKLFPALIVILFVWKRNWRALAGFFLGVTLCVGLSLFLFGPEVHRVFVREVLSQASRGDWLGPYVLSQNSFSTLWSHLFLIEPELNPSPLVNSPTLYAVVLAITVTILIVAFLRSLTGKEFSRAMALHWAATVPLLLLLSTTTAADYSCLLIFSAVVGVDALLAMGRRNTAVIFLLLYVVACAPIPARILLSFPLYRLIATVVLYALLLHSARAGRAANLSKRWLVVGVASVSILTLFNLHSVQNRAEDFSRRVPTPANAYRFANPVPAAEQVAFTEMQPAKYAVGLVSGGFVDAIPMPGDALSVAGSPAGALYAELTGRKSFIVRLRDERLGSSFETVTEGQDPALSANGSWLAFIREAQGIRTAWLLATDSPTTPQQVLASAYQPIEVTVTDEGEVIASAGNVSDPHLVLVGRGRKEVVTLPFEHPSRYPSISPDGTRLAFSRRDNGFWHLIVRSMANGYEQQLTHASCNATSPAWANDRTVLYASDCGRGVGLSAIARVEIPDLW